MAPILDELDGVAAMNLSGLDAHEMARVGGVRIKAAEAATALRRVLLPEDPADG